VASNNGGHRGGGGGISIGEMAAKRGIDVGQEIRRDEEAGGGRWRRWREEARDGRKRRNQIVSIWRSEIK